MRPLPQLSSPRPRHPFIFSASRRPHQGALALSAAAMVASMAIGCGSSEGTDRSTSGAGGSAVINGSGGASGSAGSSSMTTTGDVPGTGGSGGASTFGNLTGGATGGASGSGTNEAPSCATASAAAMLIKQPVDIILVLDNSGSMSDELTAVEQNINVNFATILNTAMVDYRVILISRHRKEMRTPSGESSTSVCVEKPLSGLMACPSTANDMVKAPVFSDRFFQYNIKIESHDSWETGILLGYHTADARTSLTTVGWKEWLRPKAKKVILEMSDDDEGAGDDSQILTVDSFLQKLTAMAPEFGTDAQHPTFVFHSIIGIAEKSPVTEPYLPTEPVQTMICKGNGDKVSNAGPTYQELSRRTGGLRFPICQFTGYNAVFQKIADDVISKTQLACNFPIPAPPVGEKLDLTKVAVKYTKGDKSGSVQFGQAAKSSVCQTNAFYIQDNNIYLCPDTCNTVQADGKAAVDVLFTCSSTIIVN